MKEQEQDLERGFDCVEETSAPLPTPRRKLWFVLVILFFVLLVLVLFIVTLMALPVLFLPVLSTPFFKLQAQR
jgi:hypothetical protein